MSRSELLADLPGADLVLRGLKDLEAGPETVHLLLVALAGPRLVRAKILAAVPLTLAADTELKLYRLLRQEPGDAYSKDNALLRQIVSFEQALDKRLREAGL